MKRVIKYFLTIVAIGGLLLGVLIYQYKNSPFLSDVYVMYPDGYIKQVSPPDGGVYYEANIKPDGSAVVYFGAKEGSPRLWVTDLQTGDWEPITSPDYSARHPAFSADGAKIVFSSSKAFIQEQENINEMTRAGTPSKSLKTNIFVMGLEERKPRQVTFGPFQDQRPTFSPDAKEIAFVSNRSGDIRIWRVSLDGVDNEPELLIPDRYAYRPNYSPDGRWLYFFVEKSKRRHQICRLNLTDSKIDCLENDDRGYSHGPFVTPDGSSVLTHSTRGGNWKIWQIPIGGGEPELIKMHGMNNALHATMSNNDIIAFDTIKKLEPLQTLLGIKAILFDNID